MKWIFTTQSINGIGWLVGAREGEQQRGDDVQQCRESERALQGGGDMTNLYVCMQRRRRQRHEIVQDYIWEPMTRFLFSGAVAHAPCSAVRWHRCCANLVCNSGRGSHHIHHAPNIQRSPLASG